MFFKLLRYIAVLFSSFVMFKFAIPKLQSSQTSMESFLQFSTILPIDAKVFMYFTGAVELLIAIVLFLSLFIVKIEIKNKLQITGYSMLLVTMLSAIIIENFVRINPIAMLVIIAILMVIISIIELILLLKESKAAKKLD